MSDPSTTQTPPTTWTPSKTVATVGSGAGVIGLAHYVQLCIAAGHVVAPSVEMIGMALTVLAYPAHLIWTILINRLQKAAGVTAALLLLVMALPLAGCETMNAGSSAAINYLAGNESSTKQNVQKADDLNLKALTDALCAIPYGAVVRNATGNPKIPAAIMDACGLPQGVTIVTNNAAVTISTGTGSVTVPTTTTTVTPE